MESSIAVFLMRQSACELLPTISLLQQRNVERKTTLWDPRRFPESHKTSTRAQARARDDNFFLHFSICACHPGRGPILLILSGVHCLPRANVERAGGQNKEV